MDTEAQYVNAAQAARMAGVTRQAIHHHLVAGGISGRFDGAVWRIPTAEVKRYRDARLKRLREEMERVPQ